MKKDKGEFLVGSSLLPTHLETNLHTALHKLRNTEPVSWLPALDAWYITSFELCTHVMRDAKTYTVDHPGFSTAQVVGESMLSLDGAEQQRHRQPFEKPFRKKAVEQEFSTTTKDYIENLLSELLPNKKAELRRDFAGPIAVQTMIQALGLNHIPVTEVLDIYDSIVQGVTDVSAGYDVSPESQKAYGLLTENLLPSLHAKKADNLLAAASGVATGLTEKQIISNAAILLFGGIETTEGMIANALYFLLTNADVLKEVKEDSTLIANVIEESLRLEPAASVVDRYATQDTQLGDVFIQEGDLVRVSLTGANCDPTVFPNPDSFDIHRDNLRSHVSFAQGPHVCLGLHLARLETQLALELILEKLPKLKLEESPESFEAAKPTGLIFRKPTALNTVW